MNKSVPTKYNLFHTQDKNEVLPITSGSARYSVSDNYKKTYVE
jgi:hypothetical protein